MTISELAREIHVAKATVHEHINILTEANLVVAIDDTRKWKYYELTVNGKKLLSPDTSYSFRLFVSIAGVIPVIATIVITMYYIILGFRIVQPPVQGLPEGIQVFGIIILLISISAIALLTSFRLKQLIKPNGH